MIVSALSLGERVARVASRVRGFFPQSLATSELGLILLSTRVGEVHAVDFLISAVRRHWQTISSR